MQRASWTRRGWPRQRQKLAKNGSEMFELADANNDGLMDEGGHSLIKTLSDGVRHTGDLNLTN